MLPRCLIGDEFGLFDAGFHIRKFETDTLEAADFLAELFTVGSIVEGEFKCTVTTAQTQ